jgi:hypothetical protein
MILKAYKFKLKNKAKLRKLHQFTGCCRFVWNKALALQLEMNILRAGQALSGDIGRHKAT